MTYTATRYYRTPGRMHACPDARRDHNGEPDHYLRPIPGERVDTFACPYALDQEHAEAYQAARQAEQHVEHERTAADIADTLIRDTATEQTDPQTRDLLRETAYAAALQALTQKETDR